MADKTYLQAAPLTRLTYGIESMGMWLLIDGSIDNHAQPWGNSQSCFFTALECRHELFARFAALEVERDGLHHLLTMASFQLEDGELRTEVLDGLEESSEDNPSYFLRYKEAPGHDDD